jgi:hypothetical protein
VFLAAAEAANAAGVAYIENNNVQVASLDGATKRALTTDGSATRQYESVAQTASGRVFASVGNGSDPLKQFVRFAPDGTKLSEYTAPYDNAGGWTSFAYPLGFEVSGDEANIAFGFLVSRFPIGSPGNRNQGTWVSPADHSAGMPPYENPDVNQPTFFGNRIVGVNNVGDTVAVQNADNAPYQDNYTLWLSTGGAPGIELNRVAIAPNGTTYAIEYTASGQRGIELRGHTGDPIPGGTDTLACDYPTAANPQRVSFSPDSATMAWRDDEGVKVAPVPAVTGTSGPCAASAPTLISSSGTSPSLGGINVQAGGGDGGGDGGGGGSGGDDDAPETEKGKGPKRKTTKRTAKFVFGSSEPGSTFECKLDRKPERPCTSPAKVKKLKRGKHTFTATASDGAGNVDDSPAVWKWKVVGK